MHAVPHVSKTMESAKRRSVAVHESGKFLPGWADESRASASCAGTSGGSILAGPSPTSRNRPRFVFFLLHKKNKRPYGERPEISPPPLRAFHRSFGSHAYRISSTMRGFAVLVLAAAVSGSPLEAQPQAQRRRRFGSRPVAASAAWVAPSTPARASRVSAWTRAAASPQQQRICTADVRMEADLYTVLGVPRSASDRDIKNVRRCPPLQSPRHGCVLCTVVQTQRSLGWTRRCGSSGARWRVLTSSAPLLRAAPPTRLLSHVETRGLAVLYPHPPSCPHLSPSPLSYFSDPRLSPGVPSECSQVPPRREPL